MKITTTQEYALVNCCGFCAAPECPEPVKECQSVDVEEMARAYEENMAKYKGGMIYYRNNQEAFTESMRMALKEQGVVG
jgi:hypothetical protein